MVFSKENPCPSCGDTSEVHREGAALCRYRQSEQKKRLKQKAAAPTGIKTIKQKMDGSSWMVSVLHPDFKDEGSRWPSERAGGTPHEAAISYLMDTDNDGASLAAQDHEMTLVLVIDQPLAPSGKQWKVHIFQIDEWIAYAKPTISSFS